MKYKTVTFIITGVLFLVLAMTCSNTPNNNESQMGQLTVKKIEFSEREPSIAMVKKALDDNNIEFHPIDKINWADYPYKPQVKFRIAHSEDEIYIQYVVKEDGTRATFGEDIGSRPFTDSCVEFFMIPSATDSIYYNLEMNCIGHGTFDGGAMRRPRTRFGEEVMSRIRRESTLGDIPFGDREGIQEWTLTIAIPKSLYSLSETGSFSGRTVRANFYKCGDDMRLPHYLSWNEVGTERPNFHTPEYFGTIIFE
ncbi:MAG: carbohydrate-binding family 9-like protein [Bacteroidales bacterium]